MVFGTVEILAKFCLDKKIQQHCDIMKHCVFLRNAVVEVVEVYQHDDQEDVFEREPFSALFRTLDGNEGQYIYHRYLHVPMTLRSPCFTK